jgi:acylphosphatase
MMKRVRIVVSGLVQGVFFRLNTKRKAQELGICGWVKNRNDGTVEMMCEGPEKKIIIMIDWCKKGPEGSLVSNTEIKWENYTGEFKAFQIIYE